MRFLALLVLSIQVAAQTLSLSPGLAYAAALSAGGETVVLCIDGKIRHVPISALESGVPLDEILADVDRVDGEEGSLPNGQVMCPACALVAAAVLADPVSLPSQERLQDQTFPVDHVQAVKASTCVLPPSRAPPLI